MVRATHLTLFIGLSALALTGCDVARSARSDIGRLGHASFSSPSTASRPVRSTSAYTASRTSHVTTEPSVASVRDSPPAADRDEVVAPRVNLVGQNENDIRARFGAPSSVEDRTPGKTWRYRHGPCALDVSLYPDVQTRKYTTLAYEVRSDDNSDQGKQRCLGQLQSRSGTR